MTSKTPVRAAEDVDESSLNYAEIKALATGNPLIKEKMDLDNQVTKLKMLESNYKSNKYSLEDKVNKFYPKEIKSTQNLISRIKEDINQIESKPDGEDKFTSITLQGENITDKKLAGEKLLEAIKAVRIGEEQVIGRYRNFDVEVAYNSFANQYTFALTGKAKHYGTLGTSADGNITRLDNVLDKMPERLEQQENKLITTKEQLENAKEELKKPFEKEQELQDKVLRLAELNKLLDMGEVEELENESPLLEDLKRVIIDYCNEEYDEEYDYEDFDSLYPDLAHVGIAYTEILDGHGVQYELNLEEYTWTQYLDGEKVDGGSFDYDNLGKESALKNMITQMQLSTFGDFVYVSDEIIMKNLNLEMDEEGNFHDPLAKDLDNDGIPDRYDHDFMDSDYMESAYDIDGLTKDEKPSILGQIKEFRDSENKNQIEKEAKDKDREL